MRFRSLLLPCLMATVVLSCRSQDGGNGDTASADAASPDSSSPPTGAMAGEAMSGETAAGGTGSAPGAGQDGATQDFLDQEAERLQRLHEKQQYVADQYLAEGNEKIGDGDLMAALVAYSNALEVMPSNQEARDQLRHVETLMGSDYAAATGLLEDMTEVEVVRRQQARMIAEGHMLDGDRALRDGQYALAVERYRQAELVLRYEPMIATDSLDERIVRNKLESALGLQDEARREGERLRQAEAEQDRLRAEDNAREQRANVLQALYRESLAAFQRENYKLAESLATQILVHDPGNEDAIQMRDIAAEARHQKVSRTIERDTREQWQRTFQDLATLHAPQVDTMIYDIERWRQVNRRKPFEFDATTEAAGGQGAEIVERLELVRFAPKFGVDGEGAPLEEIASFLQQITGVNFVISTTVRDELDEEETTIYLDLPERSVLKVLDLISSLSESLRWKVEDGVVKFVTIDEMVGNQVLRMFDVQDLIHPVRDFPGRDINVEPSNGIEPAFEDIEEREALVVTGDSLETLIIENVDPESWDLDPNNALRVTEQGVLVVNQTPRVLEKIQNLLDDLREATGIMVDIQTRFLTVEDNFLEDIGVDFRGLGPPGPGNDAFFDDFGDATAQATLGQTIGQDTDTGFFYDEGQKGNLKGRVENLYDSDLGSDDTMGPSGGLSFQWVYLNDLEMSMILRAVSKNERIQIVTAPRVLVFNTARSNLSVMNQVAYVQDFDVEIAQGASIADPIVNIIDDGVILDVRPVVSADRRFITLELRPTVATLVRPMKQITTTLGGASSVTIMLPEIDISRVRTSVPMPDGATVMLGGMKLSERQDYRSGVPILNKIPILSLLFERKGTYIGRRKLLILLKANIVIPEEHEPTAAQMGSLEGAPN